MLQKIIISFLYKYINIISFTLHIHLIYDSIIFQIKTRISYSKLLYSMYFKPWFCKLVYSMLVYQAWRCENMLQYPVNCWTLYNILVKQRFIYDIFVISIYLSRFRFSKLIIYTYIACHWSTYTKLWLDFFNDYIFSMIIPIILSPKPAPIWCQNLTMPAPP